MLFVAVVLVFDLILVALLECFLIREIRL
jgi:hypothetical protein